jgi:poly(3-hydroxybutyrate) depolymerase
MNIRPISRAAHSSPRLELRIGWGAGAVIALALSSCSSDDPATPTVPSAAPTQTAPSSEGTTPGSDGSSAAPMPSDTPVDTATEGPQPIDVAQPAGEPSSEPSTPEPEDEDDEEGAPPAVPSAGCGTTRTLQDGNQTIMSGGVSRQYFLETPDDYDSTLPHRVVFMFHWNFGSINAIVNPPDADQNTDRPFYGFGDLTDDQTIFVVPQGLISQTGGAGWQNPDNRDVNFTDDMLAAISSDLCIDTSRVFTTGFSFGAGMSLALACTRPDKFRAAVVYEPGFISGVNGAQCTTPIALFESHGVDDQIINYQTGLAVINTFSALNGCTAMTPPNPPQDGHTCVSYEGCSVPTRFCNFGSGQGNPHNVSLRGHYPSAKDPGQTTSWIPAEAWAFITQF